MLTTSGLRGVLVLEMRLRGDIETSIDVLLVRRAWKAHGLDRTCQPWGQSNPSSSRGAGVGLR